MVVETGASVQHRVALAALNYVQAGVINRDMPTSWLSLPFPARGVHWTSLSRGTDERPGAVPLELEVHALCARDNLKRRR